MAFLLLIKSTVYFIIITSLSDSQPVVIPPSEPRPEDLEVIEKLEDRVYQLQVGGVDR